MAYKLYSNDHIRALQKELQAKFPTYRIFIDLTNGKDIYFYINNWVWAEKRFKTKRECICYLLGLLDFETLNR